MTNWHIGRNVEEGLCTIRADTATFFMPEDLDEGDVRIIVPARQSCREVSESLDNVIIRVCYDDLRAVVFQVLREKYAAKAEDLLNGDDDDFEEYFLAEQ